MQESTVQMFRSMSALVAGISIFLVVMWTPDALAKRGDANLKACFGTIPGLPAHESQSTEELIAQIQRLANTASKGVVLTDRQAEKLGKECKKHCQQAPAPSTANRKRLQKIAARVKRIAPHSKHGYTLTLSGRKVLNAYMGPGGQGCVFEGILNRLERDDSVAMVVAHEVAHSVLEHSEQQVRLGMVFESMGSKQLGDVWTLFEVGMRTMGLGEYLKTLREVKDLAVKVSALSTAFVTKMVYDQEQEYEADRLGICLLKQAGYDPDAAPEFFQLIRDNSESTRKDGWNSFVSSHPVSKERIAYLKKLARLLRK
jgi:predicted Zn-dependent protease